MHRRRFLQIVTGWLAVLSAGLFAIRLSALSTELEAVTAIHDVLHDTGDQKVARIDAVIHAYTGPPSATLDQMHVIVHNTWTKAEKLGAIHAQSHAYLEGSPTTTTASTTTTTVAATTTTSVPGEIILTGDIDAVVAAGTVARLRGNCRLVNNLHVAGGTLTADETVVLDGQGLWDIHTHDGGILNLQGQEKTAWCHWGDPVVGWQVGDRLGVAPNAAVYKQGGEFFNVHPTEVTWQGSWAATTRPANSADLTLVDGSIARPEVANLSQTLVLKNLTRIMVHEAHGTPNVHTLKWLNVRDSGITDQLTFYPIHFHLLGETARGSLIEGVVVEGGKNHAFVPHASHGITIKDSVAYNIINDAYWWDHSVNTAPVANNSNDSTWDHNLALGVYHKKGTTVDGVRLTAFMIGSGSGNRIVNCAAAAIFGGDGGNQCSGYHWPSKANDNPGGTVWEFHHNTAHNSRAVGYFSWQNDGLEQPHVHEISDIVAYNCLIGGVQHGAYVNKYHWRRMVLGPNNGRSIQSRAQPPHADYEVSFEDFQSDAPFEIAHQIADVPWFILVKGPVPSVIAIPKAIVPVNYEFRDTGLTPAEFTITTFHQQSILKIVEAGVETHRWHNGVWT